ncbi:hypothetical protein DMB66_23925 [Actinoplanes sp. ATCC 53533]|uniref:hypothetical protein n=1 Tax=Actinoplanes sp. ATCC 53533 TaxID=1288362 RepID=UPI000F77F982|nr:hypothetical protein [Actinoplanes sp. ATCC 53533]RSM61752.1 hypothetical protein DMB66_23925 [Actinoplanes sp. ATCC 53533]
MNADETAHETIRLLVVAALIALAWIIAVAAPLICLALLPTGCAQNSIVDAFYLTAITAAAATWYISRTLL